jgi:hypothetical protein
LIEQTSENQTTYPNDAVVLADADAELDGRQGFVPARIFWEGEKHLRDLLVEYRGEFV